MLPEVEARILKVIGDEKKANEVLTIIYEAECSEKSLRLKKQIDGIEDAKKRGVQFGRPLMEYPKNFLKIYKKQCDGLLTVTEASRALSISRQQFYRLRKRFEDEQA